MKSSEIRRRFFAFFEKQEHTKVASSSLIPAQDPTLLFANAGMNQFKDVFLGLEQRSYIRAVTVQKCVRAGGKHNDLDNVGFTKRHLTFFEMMGNFSFGDYFKKEAIEFAWDFLINDMKLPKDAMHVSVYKTDDESFAIWESIGVPKERIHRLGEAENFWQMGDTGPCGPCTELHIDRGPAFGCSDITSCGPACDCDRFLEIWNLVFMQFDRQADGTDVPLKKTGVDTGMGIERLASVVQNVDSVFHTDLFAPLIKKIESLTGIDYHQQSKAIQNAFHVLCDHIRSASLIIADGGAPSNEGRGYVVRKIIRRAALFSQKLSETNIFPELLSAFVQAMGEVYPELVTNEPVIYKILKSEVEKFETNLVRGQAILEDYFVESAATQTITGAQTFKLYDTYGFPTELIELIAKEKGYTVDKNDFEQHMAQQQAQSGKKLSDHLDTLDLGPDVQSEFTGYQELETSSTIQALVHDNKPVSSVPQGQTCWVIAQQSPFFIVGGGQVPDKGWLVFNGHKVEHTCVRYIGKGIACEIKAPIDLQVGDAVTSIVNKELRIKAMKNHTGTHMLQAALIQVLGNTIKQSGSLVHPDYLRFDFTYHENLQEEQIKEVERIVNEKIMEDIPVTTEYTTYSDAIKRGALAFFGDKYNPEKVRIVDIPHFSAELCGGTHVPATGVIGCLKVIEVTALSAGHRRIIAVTGPKALELFQDTFTTVKTLSQEFKVQREEVFAAVYKQKELIQELQRSLKTAKKELLNAQIPTWLQTVTPVNGIPFAFITIDTFAADELKETATTLAARKPGFYCIVANDTQRFSFIAYCSPDYAHIVNMKKFASWLKDTHNIRCGGKEESIQGGGAKFDANLEASIKEWVARL